MNELRAIVRALAAFRGEGAEPPVLATLVRLRGSSYRRPGARMLVRPDGNWAGFLSGGCLEADVAERARRVAADGTPRRVTYDTRAGEDDLWGLAMGCNGVVEILLEPLPADDDPGHPAHLLARLRARERGALVTVAAPDDAPGLGTRAWVDARGVADRWLPETALGAAGAAIEDGEPRWTAEDRTDGTVEWFVEPFLPPIRLVLIGAGPDAPPLARLADGLGWPVVVTDPRPAFADPARFADLEDVAVVHCAPEEVPARVAPDERTAVVIMTHHFPRDRAALRAVLETPVPYVGLLGPRKRSRDLLDRLAEEDGVLPDRDGRNRLHAPVGLDLGATGPEEIALAIVAEIRATFSGRDGGPLRERSGPIHG